MSEERAFPAPKGWKSDKERREEARKAVPPAMQPFFDKWCANKDAQEAKASSKRSIPITDKTVGFPVKSPSKTLNAEVNPCCVCASYHKLSRHHLIPLEYQRSVNLTPRNTRCVYLCEECHIKIHKAVSNRLLGQWFNTVDALRLIVFGAQPSQQDAPVYVDKSFGKRDRASRKKKKKAGD